MINDETQLNMLCSDLVTKQKIISIFYVSLVNVAQLVNKYCRMELSYSEIIKVDMVEFILKKLVTLSDCVMSILSKLTIVIFDGIRSRNFH